jgi:DNA polymerase III alpha subunit
MYLNCHSVHSLRYGTIPIEELVSQAQQMGVQALALTDINATNGVFDFIQACRKVNIKPLIGAEFRTNGKLLYVAIAQNKEGFREINTLLSESNINKQAHPLLAPLWNDVTVIYPFKNCLDNLNENEYIGIHESELSRLQYSRLGDL